jgi:hypothetical protein
MFTVTVFLPVRSGGKALLHGKSNWYQAKILDANRIPLPGVATVQYPG